MENLEDLVKLAESRRDVDADSLAHAILMQQTASSPCRVIEVGGQPYLERYYMGTDGYECQCWLHRFLRNDSEPHLHTHPFIAESTMLCGWYIEQTPQGLRLVEATKSNMINFATTHRIVAVAPNTWTFLLVYPERLDTWQFIGDDGKTETVQSAGVDWWKNYGPRPAEEQ